MYVEIQFIRFSTRHGASPDQHQVVLRSKSPCASCYNNMPMPPDRRHLTLTIHCFKRFRVEHNLMLPINLIHSAFDGIESLVKSEGERIGREGERKAEHKSNRVRCFDKRQASPSKSTQQLQQLCSDSLTQIQTIAQSLVVSPPSCFD